MAQREPSDERSMVMRASPSLRAAPGATGPVLADVEDGPVGAVSGLPDQDRLLVLTGRGPARAPPGPRR